MYGRRNQTPPFWIMLILAIIAGVAFWWWDRDAGSAVPAPSMSQSEPEQILTEEPQRFAAAPTAEANRLEDGLPTPVALAGRSEVPAGTTLFIPNAAIYSDVIQAYLNGQSWDISELRQRVGHLEGTAWIDRPGNVVLSGHVELSDGRPGIFAQLENLSPNDVVLLESQGVQHRYYITQVYRTTPDDLQPLQPTSSRHQLTLITCGDYDWINDRYEERVIVVAERA